MTLLQTQCHQGFPGSKGPENFLFFHWWQTPFLPVNKASNPSTGTLWRVTVFCGEEQTLKFVLYLNAASDCWFHRINNLALLSYLEVKHEQVILDWQQNIKSARPELLRNQRLRPFLRSEEVSNWRTMKSNRHSRICRTLGYRTMSQWRAMNIGSVKGVIIRHMVSSVGMATANAWEQKCGRWRNDHPSHTTKGCVPLSSDVNMKDWS